MPSWSVTVLPDRGRTHRLRLAGTPDATATVGLPQALADAGRLSEPLVIDVSGVPRLSAIGLRALARAEHSRLLHGGSLTLTGACDPVRRELAQAGLLELALPPAEQRASA